MSISASPIRNQKDFVSLERNGACKSGRSFVLRFQFAKSKTIFIPIVRFKINLAKSEI